MIQGTRYEVQNSRRQTSPLTMVNQEAITMDIYEHAATVLCQLLDARYKNGSIAHEFKF